MSKPSTKVPGKPGQALHGNERGGAWLGHQTAPPVTTYDALPLVVRLSQYIHGKSSPHPRDADGAAAACIIAHPISHVRRLMGACMMAVVISMVGRRGGAEADGQQTRN